MITTGGLYISSSADVQPSAFHIHRKQRQGGKTANTASDYHVLTKNYEKDLGSLVLRPRLSTGLPLRNITDKS